MAQPRPTPAGGGPEVVDEAAVAHQVDGGLADLDRRGVDAGVDPALRRGQLPRQAEEDGHGDGTGQLDQPALPEVGVRVALGPAGARTSTPGVGVSATVGLLAAVVELAPQERPELGLQLPEAGVGPEGAAAGAGRRGR
jgi:hypothetical protein